MSYVFPRNRIAHILNDDNEYNYSRINHTSKQKIVYPVFYITKKIKINKNENENENSFCFILHKEIEKYDLYLSCQICLKNYLYHKYFITTNLCPYCKTSILINNKIRIFINN